MQVPNEPKPFASLSSGLLARKGAARPAMRPQGFGQVGNGLEDLGWNDMGFEPPKAAEVARDADHDAFGEDVVEHPRVHPTGLTPIGSPVHDQQSEILERFAGANAEERSEDGAAEIYEPEEEETAEVYEPKEEETAELYQPEEEETVEPFEPEADEAPARSPVLVKPALAKRFAVTAAPAPLVTPRSAPSPRSAPGIKSKAAFTLRLDSNRHLKLRLACAVDGRSAQQLVTDALDQLLERMPDLDGLAEKAKLGGKTNEQAAS
jgi:hypothetical protein